MEYGVETTFDTMTGGFNYPSSALQTLSLIECVWKFFFFNNTETMILAKQSLDEMI